MTQTQERVHAIADDALGTDDATGVAERIRAGEISPHEAVAAASVRSKASASAPRRSSAEGWVAVTTMTAAGARSVISFFAAATSPAVNRRASFCARSRSACARWTSQMRRRGAR